MSKKVTNRGASGLMPGILMVLTILRLFPGGRRGWRRGQASFVTAIFAAVLIATAGLFILSKWQRRSTHEIIKFGAGAERQEDTAPAVQQTPSRSPMNLSGNRPGPQSAIQTVESANPPPAAFTVNCADCHGSRGQGGEVGPSLIGVSAKPRRGSEDLDRLLDSPRAFGLRPPMPESFSTLSTEEKRHIIEWLSNL
jgi:mono/diheme cytochrome c family protein